jgi:hypothetical protein
MWPLNTGVAILHYIDICIFSNFDMYCGGCYNVPFWRWLRINQNFSRSVTCNDYSGTYLENLQPSNFSHCFSEYLLVLRFDSIINYISPPLKCLLEKDRIRFLKQHLSSNIHVYHTPICYHVNIVKSVGYDVLFDHFKLWLISRILIGSIAR